MPADSLDVVVVVMVGVAAVVGVGAVLCCGGDLGVEVVRVGVVVESSHRVRDLKEPVASSY